MFKYSIKLFFLLGLAIGFSQEATTEQTATDSVQYKQIYGLRVGVDLSRPARTFYDGDYSGFEIMGDFRVTHRLFIAAELGNEKFERTETLGSDDNPNQIDIYNYESSGSYIKLGVDWNTYENWYGMNNSIFVGGRVAFSSFSQTLNDYTIFESNRYWNPDGFVQGSQAPEEFKSLNATWLELIFGVKAEIFNNLFAGASVRLGYILTDKQSDRIRNLWIPGFNKVTEDSSFGVGYNYYLTYLIPIYKKAKKQKPPTEE